MNERARRAARKRRRGVIVRLLAIFALPLIFVLVAPVMAGETWTLFSYVFIYVLLAVAMALYDLQCIVVPTMRERRARNRRKAS